MAIKTFGKELKTNQDFVDEVYALAGANFPLTISVANGQLLSVTYETEWQEGTTTPVEKPDPETGEPTIEYKGDYKKQKLSAAQIKKIDAWVKDNIAE